MKNKTFATTFFSIAEFAAGCDLPEIADPRLEPGKTETPEARQELQENTQVQTSRTE